MAEEATPVPENWFEQLGIEKPEIPTPEELAEAWRTLADYSTLYSLIQDLDIALRRLESDPKAKELVRRYRPITRVILSDAELLLNKMREDFEKGQKFDGDSPDGSE